MADEQRKPQPIPVGSGERVSSIPPAPNSFAAKGAGLLQGAPEWHHSFDQRFGIKSEAQARMELSAGASTGIELVSGRKIRHVESRKLGVGDVVKDTQRDVKVMILKANVGKTNKGNPVHLVIHRMTGEEWRLSESKMKRM